jgi:heme-degrading monooxygenase HmoA
MFVQLIRATLKPGAWDKAEEQFRRWQREQAPMVSGFKGEYLLREKDVPNGCIAVVLFENEQLARQNSERPETNEFYQEFLGFCDGKPQFIDTHVVHSYLL